MGNLAQLPAVAESLQTQDSAKIACVQEKAANVVQAQQVADTIGNGETTELLSSGQIHFASILSKFMQIGTSSTLSRLASIIVNLTAETKNSFGANRIINHFAKSVTTSRLRSSTADLAD